MEYLCHKEENMEFFYKTSDDTEIAGLALSELGHSRPAPGKRVEICASSCHLHFITEGKGRFDGEEIFAGQGFLVLKGETYREEADREAPFEQYWLNFDGESVGDVLKMAGLSEKTRVFTCRRIHRIGETLKALFSAKPKASAAFYAAFFEILLLLSYEERSEVRENGTIRRVTEYVSSHLGSPIAAGDVAAYAGLSPKYLSRLFKNTTGKTLTGYVTEARLRAACTLLSGTDASIDRIAREVGFRDPLYFSKVFKKAYGVPPKVYRTGK